MNRNSPSEVIALIKEMNFKPSRVLGQNFLIDGNIRDQIVDAACVGENEHVLEVGPGLGMLTEKLLEKAGKVTAVEKDDMLYAYLAKEFGAADQLELIHGDALDVGIESMGAGCLVSNLPYSVGSRVIMDMVLAEQRPERMVVMVQLDVADRIVSPANCKSYGIISVMCQMYYEVSKLKKLKPSCFYPPPGVHSAVVVMTRRDEPLGGNDSASAALKTVKNGFSKRRKMLNSVLTAEEKDRAALLGIALTKRPQELSVEEWGQLSVG